MWLSVAIKKGAAILPLLDDHGCCLFVVSLAVVALVLIFVAVPLAVIVVAIVLAVTRHGLFRYGFFG